MKGIILAGGSGTRLKPLTSVVNKHLLPVGPYPMIHYAVDKLSEAGVREVLLVTGKQSAGLYAEYLGSGEAYGIRLYYAIQEKAGGIAEALGLAESFVQPEDKLVVLLGDNLFQDPLTPYVEAFRRQAAGASVLLKKVADPRRYGVPVLMPDGSVARIVEKPANPPSDYCVTGIYMYHADVFRIIRELEPSARGELEITDVNNVYAEAGKLSSRELTGWWIDAGTLPSLREASGWLYDAAGVERK